MYHVEPYTVVTNGSIRLASRSRSEKNQADCSIFASLAVNRCSLALNFPGSFKNDAGKHFHSNIRQLFCSRVILGASQHGASILGFNGMNKLAILFQ